MAACVALGLYRAQLGFLLQAILQQPVAIGVQILDGLLEALRQPTLRLLMIKILQLHHTLGWNLQELILEAFQG